MANEAPCLTLLQRREIEARIVAPFVRAVMSELGDVKTLELLRGVVASLARESGAAMAREFGEATLTAFARGLDRWKEGGALEIEIVEQSRDRLDFNVTRCRYAELYRALGMADLGSTLSCCRDFALIEGFNPAVSLTRTQTIMEGASHCDFRFRNTEEPSASECDRESSSPGDSADHNERTARTGPEDSARMS
ncbi:MAG: hypothetical protein JWN86_434 [Planctomycetota bacterium]|nr:hypothetical protein [Planctomycetota bacterium]